MIANAWLSMQAMRSPIATIHFSELVTALASLCLTPVLILIRGIDYHSLDILQEAVLRILRATVTMLPSLTSPPVVPCSGNRPSPDAWWARAASEPPNGVNGSMPSCCPTATMAGPLPPLSPAPARRFPLVYLVLRCPLRCAESISLALPEQGQVCWGCMESARARCDFTATAPYLQRAASWWEATACPFAETPLAPSQSQTRSSRS